MTASNHEEEMGRLDCITLPIYQIKYTNRSHLLILESMILGKVYEKQCLILLVPLFVFFS